MIKYFGVNYSRVCSYLAKKRSGVILLTFIYYWNFIKVNKIYNNHVKRNGFNPDGKDCNWICDYKNKHIMFCFFV